MLKKCAKSVEFLLLRDRPPAQAGLTVEHMWYVYFIKSSKKRWYYVGSTNNLERRLKEHNSGMVLSTKRYSPLGLVFKKEFEFEKEARMYERKVKDKRIEKENIIRKIENS